MASKHYGWQKQWTVTLDRRVAEHESGLVVNFASSDGSDKWIPSTDPASLQAWNAKQLTTMPPPDVTKRQQRLMREASEIWHETLEKTQ